MKYLNKKLDDLFDYLSDDRDGRKSWKITVTLLFLIILGWVLLGFSTLILILYALTL